MNREKIQELVEQRRQELQQKIDEYNRFEEQQRELIKEIMFLQGRINELEELLKNFQF